jgi:hypothetical protein
MSRLRPSFPRGVARACALIGLAIALTGCAHAPSFNVLGSYFPGWIACIALSVLFTALVRFLLKRLEWEHTLPALPLFYFSVAVLNACSFWLIAFE